MLMPLCGNRRTEITLVMIPIIAVAMHIDVAMWSIRRNGQEEGFLCIDCLIEESVCFLSQDISTVLPLVVLRLLLVALEGTVEVVVSTWIKQEVLVWLARHEQSWKWTVYCAGEPGWIWGVIVPQGVDIE